MIISFLNMFTITIIYYVNLFIIIQNYLGIKKKYAYAIKQTPKH